MKHKFSDEFKAEALRLMLEQGLAPAQAGRDLGLGQSTLDVWLKAKRAASEPDALTEHEKAELKRPRKEVSVLRMERDI